MLDGEQVVRAAPGQVGGVAALGVQRVRGDDRPADGDAVQQRGEQGDLVGLGVHVSLAQHHTVGVVQRREQVTAVFAAVGGAA